jgi:glycine/D-amino acid oxidase-like deaminating enzyme
MQDPDVIVVGAGVAGLGAAALLARDHGRQVEVFERAPFVGGRAISFVGSDGRLAIDGLTLDASGLRKALAHAGTFVARADPDLDEMLDRGLLDGCTIEAGGHGLFWGGRSRVAHLLEHLGSHVDLPVNRGLAFVDHRADDRMVQMEGGRAYPWMSDEGYASTRDTLRDMATVTPDDLRELMHTSLADWLGERRLHPEAQRFIKVLAASQTGMADPAMTPAGDFLGYMMAARPLGMNLVTGSVATVPEPGPIAIPLAFERVVTAHGGEVHRGRGVRRVVIEGGRVAGVELLDGSVVDAPTVIVTLPPKHARKVVGLTACAPENMWGAGFLTGLYGLRRDVWAERGIDERSFVFMPEVLSEGYVGAVDLVMATLGSWGHRTPPGLHDFYFSTALIDREMRDKNLVGRVVDWSDAWFRRTFDADPEFVLWTAAPEAYGTWRRVGADRPDVVSSDVAGLFFAGDQYGRRLWGGGIDGAALSAVLCVDAITGATSESEIFPWYHRGLPE